MDSINQTILLLRRYVDIDDEGQTYDGLDFFEFYDDDLVVNPPTYVLFKLEMFFDEL